MVAGILGIEIVQGKHVFYWIDTSYDLNQMWNTDLKTVVDDDYPEWKLENTNKFNNTQIYNRIKKCITNRWICIDYQNFNLMSKLYTEIIIHKHVWPVFMRFNRRAYIIYLIRMVLSKTYLGN